MQHTDTPLPSHGIEILRNTWKGDADINKRKQQQDHAVQIYEAFLIMNKSPTYGQDLIHDSLSHCDQYSAHFH